MRKSLIELPAFDAADGQAPAAAIEAYNRDGVICLRRAFDAAWVARLRDGVDQVIADAARDGDTHPRHPRVALSGGGDGGIGDGGDVGDGGVGDGDNTDARPVSVAKPGEAGAFFYAMFLWRRYPVFKQFAFESPAADLARAVMQSQTLTFYYDLVLDKAPGASSPTPWHYDEAYWPVAGRQVCNLWTALDDIPEATALRFVRGSHRLASNHRAVGFGPGIDYRGQRDPAPPDWDADTDADIVYAPLNPGDCLIINLRAHHSAPGNRTANRRRALATHWLGDDARYHDKPWQCDPDERGENLTHGGKMECASFPRIR